MDPAWSAGIDSEEQAIEELGLDEEAIARRKAYFGIDDSGIECIRQHERAWRQVLDAAIDAFYEHLQRFEPLRPWLADDARLRRLRRAQRGYLEALSEPVDRRHAMRCLRIGLVHARIGLAPEWFVGAYAVLLRAILDRLAPQTRAALEPVLVRRMLLDLSLALDAYFHAASLRERRLAEALDAVLEAVFIFSAEQMRIVYANRGAAVMTGIPAYELVGKAAWEVWVGVDADALRRWIAPVVDGNEPFVRRQTALACVDKALAVDVIFQGLGDGKRGWIIAAARDISDLLHHQRELEHLAMHDPLTGLPNRWWLEERLQQSFEAKVPVAVVLIGLRRFRAVNEVLGPKAGDQVLRAIADRLRQWASARAAVARYGGDVFALLLSHADERQALQRANAMFALFSDALRIEPYAIDIDFCIGIASGHRPAEELLREAEVAMHAAKRKQKKIVVYAPEVERFELAHFTLASELRRALRERELLLVYQPIVALDADRIVKAEALLRWHHAKRGAISPAQFVPIAEHSGIVHELTRWVLTTALHQLREWNEQGLSVQLAVNLAAANLADAALADDLAAMLQSAKLSPQQLICEITETGLIHDFDRAQRTLSQLRALGVRIALDDFGTGYSSLNYLRRLPVDWLKIDGSFVRAVCEEATTKAIVRAIVAMAHELGMQVVAEGVEDDRLLQAVRRIGCDAAQGFGIARPMEAKAFARWVRSFESGKT